MLFGMKLYDHPAGVGSGHTTLLVECIFTERRDADVIFTKDFMLTKDLLFWKFIANFNILERMKIETGLKIRTLIQNSSGITIFF